MRKTLTLSAIIFVWLGVTTVEAHHGPKTVTINEAAKKQPPVVFTHEEHAKKLKTCDTCHHTNKGMTAENSEKAKIQKCSVCHLDAKGTVPSMREMSTTKNPFHIKCLGCHKTGKKGPTACTGCHKK